MLQRCPPESVLRRHQQCSPDILHLLFLPVTAHSFTEQLTALVPWMVLEAQAQQRLAGAGSPALRQVLSVSSSSSGAFAFSFEADSHRTDHSLLVGIQLLLLRLFFQAAANCRSLATHAWAHTCPVPSAVFHTVPGQGSAGKLNKNVD